MLHPSYTELIKVVNGDIEEGDTPVVNSRYSIVIATAKRARQIIAGAEPLVEHSAGKKPLSIAVEELYTGKVKILGEDEEIEDTTIALDEEDEADEAETVEADADEAEEE